MPELTSFASRQPATFIKGTVFDHEVTTSSEMLRLAGLNGWNVHLRPLDSDARRSSETFEVVRTNPNDGLYDRLGICGERYGVVQNEQAFGMFDDLGVTWEAAGSFKGGSIVYGQAKVGRNIVIDPKGVADVIKPFLTVITTFDSSGALVIGRDAMRLACFNQFRAMKAALDAVVKVRHTLTIEDRMKKIRLAWKETLAHYAAVEAEANRLYQLPCNDDLYFRMVKELIGKRPDENKKGAATKYDGNLELFAQAWKGETNQGVRGTRFGAFQAMVERNQWGRTIQKTDNGLDNFAMAGMGLTSDVETFRVKALDLATNYGL
jgi:hypothetical protein